MSILLAIVLSLLFSAFFSGMEIAFLSANKLKIELDNKQGVFSAKLLSNFLQQPSQFIGSMLVGNNISLVLYGIFMAALLDPWIAGWGVSGVMGMVIQTVLSTLVILFMGEFIPKTLFRINPNTILNIFAIPLQLLYFVLWIPMFVMVGLSKLILKHLFRVDTTDQTVSLGRTDLDNYIKEISQTAELHAEDIDHEIQIFQKALDFSKVRARDCMVPRTEIVAISFDESIEKLRALFIESGCSKILVYRESIDNIIGYVNSSQLFKQPETVKRILVPLIFIPETISAQEVLESFIRQNKNLAVVLDEFGGTSGILTIEDIIEEIFGDIEDEHDNDDLLEEKLSGNRYHFAGRLEIDYLNDKYKIDLPESDEYETLAGFILHKNEHIPDLNSIIDIDQFTFKITGVTNVRIESVLVHIKEED